MAGKIEKLGHNHYRFRWTDKTGARRCKTVHGTRAQAQAVKAEVEAGLSGVKLGCSFAEYWASTVRPSIASLSENTRQEYERLWERELSPRIGRMSVSDFDWATAQTVVDDIEATSVQRHAFALLRKVCNMAVRDRLMMVNPCDRSIRLRQHVKRQKVLVEACDVPAFVRTIEGIKYEPVMLCMLGGGLRPEEADALRWSDIEPLDMNGKTYALVSVSKTIVAVKGGALERDRTKTASSTRQVVIGEPFASRLLSLRSSGSLCPGRDGSPSSPVTVTHNWRAWCDRNGKTYVSQENMRSSWATMHGEAGSPDSLVSLGMGHTDGTTKGRNYQQATIRGLAMIADNLADYISSVSN